MIQLVKKILFFHHKSFNFYFLEEEGKKWFDLKLQCFLLDVSPVMTQGGERAFLLYVSAFGQVQEAHPVTLAVEAAHPKEALYTHI